MIGDDRGIGLLAASTDALRRGDWRTAYGLADALRRRNAPDAAVEHCLAMAALQGRNARLAAMHLQRAIGLAPGRPDYLAQYARALLEAGDVRNALQAADSAFETGPRDGATADTIGVVYGAAGQHEHACKAFEMAVALAPDNAAFWNNLANSRLFFGRAADAERAYLRVIALEPGAWRAYLALAGIRAQTPDDNHLQLFESTLSRHAGDPDAALYLGAAIAKTKEDLGDHAGGFADLMRAKAAHRKRIAYSSDAEAADVQAIREYFRELPPPAARAGMHAPVFVVGMPRTGTTLVDRILSAHSQAESIGEAPYFGALLFDRSTRRASSVAEAIAGLDPDLPRWAGELGRQYLSMARPRADADAVRWFVDKMPRNYLLAGFIAHALPEAKIVCLRRNPLDTCVGSFRQVFEVESPHFDYSYDLLDIGRHYIRFDALMRFWAERLPGRILQLRYEDLVLEQEQATRGLLEFCGMPWRAQCLHFERSGGAVATASALQVRESMNRNGLHRWKRYAPQLAELRALLESAGIDVD